MNWNRNDPFNKSKKTVVNKESSEDADLFSEKNFESFMVDWENCRERHAGQKQVISAFFDDQCQYIFNRAGRKFAKTTTDIDIAWRFAMEKPNRVIYFCYPTIALGIEVLWEEQRLQRCDRKDDLMRDKYVAKTDDSRHIVWFTNGSYMKLIGTWSEARGRGTQPDLLVVDEIQDCSGDYLDAMDPNLAAKDGRCVMSGTPPRKRNHFYEWWDRIGNNPRGRLFKFTSYDNVALPHLREWLDRKKIELIKAGKEDEWLREYMAEDCFSNAERVLPDAIFIREEDMVSRVSLFDYSERKAVLALSMQGGYVCAMFAVLIRRKAILVMDYKIFPTIWNISLNEIFPQLGKPAKELQDLCLKKMSSIVWDPTQSFQDVIPGFSKCRSDIKWQDRGIPLLREMMLNGKIHMSEKVGDFGLECQNLLRDESQKDIEKKYPMISTLSMMVNEFFANEKHMLPTMKEFDKFQGLREMGIPCPTPKTKGKSLFRIGF